MFFWEKVGVVLDHARAIWHGLLRGFFVGIVGVVVGSGCWSQGVIQPSRGRQADLGEGDTLGHVVRPIVNGMPDEGHPAAVALIGGGGVSCSGLLVSQRVVLTAAHCIEGEALPIVVFGDNPQNGTWIPSIHSRGHPDYDPASHAYDIGVLLLPQDAPVQPVIFEPAKIDSSWIGTEVILVGYGLTATVGSEPPLRRFGIGEIQEILTNTLVLAPHPATGCGGDSGGPVFHSLSGVLVGVIASGDPECTVFTRVARLDSAVEFVTQYIAATAPGAAGPGDRCYSDENCREGTCEPALDDARLHFCVLPCNTSSDCPVGLECIEGEKGWGCRYTPPSPGALGSTCLAAEDCVSLLCAQREKNETLMCAEICFPEWPESCPDGFVCVPSTTGEDACFPIQRPQAKGCAVMKGEERNQERLGHALVVVTTWVFWYHRRKNRKKNL